MSDDGYLPEDDPAVELMLASRHGDLAYLRAHVDSFGQLDTLGDSVLPRCWDTQSIRAQRRPISRCV